MRHFFTPRENVIYAYVVESSVTKTITDFFSFYCLPSSVLNNPKYNELKVAYSYYHVATVTPLKTLMQNALILAAKNGFDVFNALNLLDNQTFLEVTGLLIAFFTESILY